MQKDNFFTRARFEPQLFYPKKCVNYDKSILRQNSVKGPKEPNSAKKFQKITKSVQNVPKNATKKRECVYYSLSQQSHFWKSLDQFGSIWTYSNLFGPIWTNLDKVGAIWRNLEPYGLIWMKLNLLILFCSERLRDFFVQRDSLIFLSQEVV